MAPQVAGQVVGPLVDALADVADVVAGGAGGMSRLWPLGRVFCGRTGNRRRRRRGQGEDGRQGREQEGVGVGGGGGGRGPHGGSVTENVDAGLVRGVWLEMVVLQVGAGHGVVATRETRDDDGTAVRKLSEVEEGGRGRGGLTFGKWMG